MQAKVHAGGLDLSFWTMLGTSSEGVDPASCMTWARNYVTGSVTVWHYNHMEQDTCGSSTAT